MSICTLCGNVIHSSKDLNRTDNICLPTELNETKIPFCCIKCNSIHFPFQAVRDVVILYPAPKSTKRGSIHLPDYNHGAAKNTQETFKESLAIVLSIGDGCYDKSGRFHTCDKIEVGDIITYEKRVPWKLDVKGTDDKMHTIMMCGYKDIYAVNS